jgi:predicted nucleic acid-binding Zn finger protein
MKVTLTITILLDFPQVNKAVVQGSTAQYVVDYAARTCTCPDHVHRHRQCKHIRFVLDEKAQLSSGDCPF